MPDIFSAIAPICVASHGIDNHANLAKIPIWKAHNISDNTVSYNETKKLSKKFSRTKTISEVDYKNNDLIFTSEEGE